ncbi:MAG: hypothetical protein LBR77_00650 [Lachnospiraceae bacterium]|jgi:hypothetical protein|nr:hypothetical protein [Lachnospiraceae bacterium]
MKKKVLAAVLAGILSAGVAFSAFASGGGAVTLAQGTDVWAGVILDDPDAKIMVEVPTLFAFVVNGSLNPDTTPIGSSLTGGQVLVPNQRVVMVPPAGTTADYMITVTGAPATGGSMVMRNYSTKAGTIAGDRVGIAVDIKGSIENSGTAASRNYWEHIATPPSTSDGVDFKKYRLSVSDTVGTPNYFSSASAGVFSMALPITLAAPTLSTPTDYNTATGYANAPSQTTVEFSVEVGGVRDDYHQVEESAKVGTIVWTIGYVISGSGNPTAPTNPFQSAP